MVSELVREGRGCSLDLQASIGIRLATFFQAEEGVRVGGHGARSHEVPLSRSREACG